MKIPTIISSLVFASMFAAPAQADAQKDAVLGSPYLAKARACLSDFAAAGKSAGLTTDREGGIILVLDPEKKEKLGEILANSFRCLDSAFEMTHTKIDRLPGAGKAGTKSWVWHALVSGLYIWCASDGDSSPEDVGYLGGHGERKNWYAISVKCGIDDKVLGWYTPPS